MLNSILDNDFYKFTMQQGVIKLFPTAHVCYEFINRGKHSFPTGFDQILKEKVSEMSSLVLTKSEKFFLQRNCPYLDPVYLDFLEGYRYDPDEVEISQKDDQLQVKIQGLWYRTILWEVLLMAQICELFYETTQADRINNEEIEVCTAEKIKQYLDLGITVADFGTRRRYSYEVHKLVLETMTKHGSDSFIGTSNVHLAMVFETKPIGTHAHEWFMFHAAKYGYQMANAMALHNWVNVYRGDLGIALSDTYTTAVFFHHFDKMYAKLFDGVRHDSGDPKVFADHVIAHYESLGINPRTKTIIFSDALNSEKISNIVAHCRNRIGMSFGVGTNLTNDVGPRPMNIVIKMTSAKPQQGGSWTSVVKLSDEPKKYSGILSAIALAKETLNI